MNNLRVYMSDRRVVIEGQGGKYVASHKELDFLITTLIGLRADLTEDVGPPAKPRPCHLTRIK